MEYSNGLAIALLALASVIIVYVQERRHRV